MDRRTLFKDFFLVVTGAVVGSGATAFWTRRIEEDLKDQHSLFVRVDPLHIVGTRLVDQVLLLIENDGDVAETNVEILISFSTRSADPMPVLLDVLSKPRILREQLADLVASPATRVAGFPRVEVTRSFNSSLPHLNRGERLVLAFDVRPIENLAVYLEARSDETGRYHLWQDPSDLTRISTPVINPVR